MARADEDVLPGVFALMDNLDESKNIASLFQRFLDNKCSRGEIKKLLQYFDVDENEELLTSLIHEQSLSIGHEALISSQAREGLLDDSLKKIKLAIGANEKSKARVIPFRRKIWLRVCAAVICFFLISATAFYFIQKKDKTVVAQKNNTPALKDIPAGTNNAILTLDDGSTIMLDSAANGTLATQGNMKVLKLNGQVAYNKTGDGSTNAKPVYNTIATARGNQYQLILADGSKVWLNAVSSIRFPASFTNNERRVEIKGEAYFEVAHLATKGGNRKIPFIVKILSESGQERGMVEVFGTHFNVNAYSDESEMRATLLEGSVKVSKGKESVLIKPGEQASVSDNSGGIRLKKDVGVLQVIAWKDGVFDFENTDLQTMMRQVARWYNVDVNFEGKINGDGYSGKISREAPLSKFLKVLELNGVHVKAEGRKLTVMP